MIVLTKNSFDNAINYKTNRVKELEDMQISFVDSQGRYISSFAQQAYISISEELDLLRENIPSKRD